jgi:hypothetical protein
MNDKFIKMALDAGLLNYVDNETPRRYFINGNADIEEVEEFAKMIVRACIQRNVKTAKTMRDNGLPDHCSPHMYNFEIGEMFDMTIGRLSSTEE